MAKLITWIGGSKSKIKRFPVQARRRSGYQLYRVQQGLLPTDWKPMSSIGLGVVEIRIHEPSEHRVLYVAKFHEAIYVLHAFEKKSQKTEKRDIEITKQAYKDVLKIREKKSL